MKKVAVILLMGVCVGCASEPPDYRVSHARIHLSQGNVEGAARELESIFSDPGPRPMYVAQYVKSRKGGISAEDFYDYYARQIDRATEGQELIRISNSAKSFARVGLFTHGQYEMLNERIEAKIAGADGSQ